MENEKLKTKYAENIIVSILILGLIGLLYILNITYLYNGYKVVIKQVIYFLSAFVIFFVILSIPAKFLNIIMRNLHIIFFCNLVLIILGYLTPLGAKINNATRWIKVGPLYFQPSEFLKYTSVLFLIWIYQYISINLTYKTIFSICSIICSAMLIGLAPDVGSMWQLLCVLLIILITMFPTKRSIMIPLTFIFLVSVFVISLYKFSHIKERLRAFKNPTLDLQYKNYQPNQLKMAIYGSNTFGEGFANSIQKLKYLPNSFNDFILAIIMEELGLFGLFTVLFVYFCIFSNIISYIYLCSNGVSKILLTSFLLYNLTNVLINTLVCIGLFPVKGITLPFISLGGSFIHSNLIFLGFGFRLDKTL